MNVDKKEVEFTLSQAKAMLDDRETPVNDLRFMVNKLSYQLKLATAEPKLSRWAAFSLRQQLTGRR
jgi:hypothetical protein